MWTKILKITFGCLFLLALNGAIVLSMAAESQKYWDKNNNLICDVETEDMNNDGICDNYDVTGGVCWDSNQNGACDRDGEDKDMNGVCDINDCQSQ